MYKFVSISSIVAFSLNGTKNKAFCSGKYWLYLSSDTSTFMRDGKGKIDLNEKERLISLNILKYKTN